MKNKEQIIPQGAGSNKKTRKALIIITASVLAVAIALTAIAVIIGINQNKVKDPVLEYKGSKLSLAFYSLMLSRTKGGLARSGYDVRSIAFWESESPVPGKTNAEYYTERTLETCKLYLLSVYLFDSEGLTLPDEYYASIDSEIADYIDLGYVGDGSEEKFNQILAPYGVDIESYREALIIKGKAEYFQEYLFGSGGSKISDELKKEYYEKYYHRFKQILVSKYYYEYEKDAFGCEIYFSGDSAKPLYDTKNGVVGFDKDQMYIRDEYQEKIYFEKDENGEAILDKPLYDKENGVRHPVMVDGVAQKVYYTEAQMAERYALAQEIMNSVSRDNFAAFESEMEKFNDASDSAEQNPDGYYLSALASSGYYEADYLNKILSRLGTMTAGERAIVESDEGYHVVMKYPLDSGAFSDSDKAVWFDNFTATIMTEVFKEKYRDILDNMTVIEENLAKCESIKFIGINFDYWK